MPLLRAVPVVLRRRRAHRLEQTRPGGEDGAPGPAARADRAAPRAAGTMCGSPRTCGSAWTPCASGGAGSPAAAWTGWLICPATGRPRRISELTRAAVVALACQLPAATGVPLSRWTGPELLAEITRAGLGRQLSVSSVLRSWRGTR